MSDSDTIIAEDSGRVQPTISLYPQRRQQATENEAQRRTVTSQYFMHSQRTAPRTLDDSGPSSDKPGPRPPDTGPPSSLKRQGLLTFTNDGLRTKRPSINPISRGDERRKALKDIAEETWLLLPGLLATRPDVTSVSFLCQKETLDPTRCPRFELTKIQVIDSDTIDAALALQTSIHNRVAVLNMANAKHPGGGWEHGALAQEEAICYRSSLADTLKSKHYPIPDEAAIYSPTVMIIRENLQSGHNLLDFRDPSLLDVISVISAAAIERPDLNTDKAGQSTYRSVRDRKLMEEKMRIILRTAIRNKHRQIVLGAFGCGVFGNPNDVVARMWGDVLSEQEFQGGYWRDVVFAILDGKGVSNFKVFKQILDGLAV